MRRAVWQCTALVAVLVTGCVSPSGGNTPVSSVTHGASPGAMRMAEPVPPSPIAPPPKPFVAPLGPVTTQLGGMVPAGAPTPPAPGAVIAFYNPTHMLIPFSSNRRVGSAGGFDVYLFDDTTQTVIVPPAANTPGDEYQPSLANNRWLIYQTNVSGHFAIWLYDLKTQLVNPLPALNGPGDNTEPTITADGKLIAYDTAIGGIDRLRIGDLTTMTSCAVPAVDHLGVDILSPTISPDGTKVVFVATVPPASHPRIYEYDLPRATLWSPPFLDLADPDAELNDPALSADNHLLAYDVTPPAVIRHGRRLAGTTQLRVCDLKTGYIDRLALANDPAANNLTPAWVGPDNLDIAFVSDRTGSGDRHIYIYRHASATLDPIPESHEPGTIDLLAAP